MRALVTGSAGFVGRHMVAALRERGWAVAEIDPAERNGMDMTQVRPNYLRGASFDLVVHCAYHVGGRKGIEGNAAAFSLNLQLDSTMFRYAVESGRVGHVLYFSSSAVYPIWAQDKQSNRHDRRLKENEVWWPGGGRFIDQGQSPDSDYGWVKLIGEHQAARARERGLPVTVVRPFSGYGADQSEDYPFPALMRRVREMVNPFPIWGDPTQVRDWVHISDVVGASLALAGVDKLSGAGAVDGPVNICTGIGTSMNELVEVAWLHAGNGEAPKIQASNDGPMGVHTRVGNPNRMHWYYRPKVTLLDGIAEALRA